MKVFFNRFPRNEPYGGGNQFLQRMTSLLEDREHKVVYHLEEDIDVIFMVDPRPGDHGYSVQHIWNYKQQHPSTKILHRINECDKRKGTQGLDGLLIKSATISDEVVFISDWLKSYFYDLGLTKNTHTIYNGCDTNIFYPAREKTLGRKVNLVTHHWSDNWMKGFDLYTKIDEYLIENPSANFNFTYVGRYYKEYTPKATSIISPLCGIPLGEELRKHDVYVTASRWEPCGMHHIEGAASGLPVIYHSETGGIKELCMKYGEEYHTFTEFLEKLNLITENYTEYLDKIEKVDISIESCCEKFLGLIDSMV